MTFLFPSRIKELKVFDCFDQGLRIVQLRQQDFDIDSMKLTNSYLKCVNTTSKSKLVVWKVEYK